jgi:hypothetical protein
MEQDFVKIWKAEGIVVPEPHIDIRVNLSVL